MALTACIAHLRLALRHRRIIRITNLLERLVLDERADQDHPHAFGEWPVLKPMYAAVIRATDRWRGILVGESCSASCTRFARNSTAAHAQRVAPVVTRADIACHRRLRI